MQILRQVFSHGFASVLLGLSTTAVLMLSQPAYSQTQQQSHTLSISGFPGEVKIVSVNGKSYVDVEDLARLTQGSLSFKPNQTVLTLAGAQPDKAAPAPPPKPGFSKEFVRAGIEQMSVIREWRIAVANAIQNNYPLPVNWMEDQRLKAEKNLALASAAITTNDDRSGYDLLASELNNMQKLSDGYVAARSQAQYVEPDSIEKDPVNQQVLACARGLAAMAADNKYRDEPACR